MNRGGYWWNRYFSVALLQASVALIAGCGGSRGSRSEISSRSQALGGFNVLTRNYNNQRTGANTSETILTQSNVNASQFGKLFMLPVDDEIYAGILYASAVPIAGGTHNVIYVATVNNTVYAFDADALGPPLWQRNFNGTGRPTFHTDGVGANCGTYNDFQGNIGIVGTPVIDETSAIIYFVTRVVETTSTGLPNTVQNLHALDITNGNERPNSPKVIQASVPGTGDDSNGTTNISFNSFQTNQRLALGLSQGKVYIGWSSFCDTRPYHGWVMAYDATTLAQVAAFSSTPNTGMGAFWMGAAAPAFDASGNVYAGTATGQFFVPAVSEFPETLLKLTPSLSRLDFFTPSNFQFLFDVDLDFASQGPVLLPPPATNRVLIGDKMGRIFVVNASNLGQVQTCGQSDCGDTQIPQRIQEADTTIVPGGENVLHDTTPAWVSPQGLNIYAWADNDFLKQFRFNPSTQVFNLPATATGSVLPPAPGQSGGILTISANGSGAAAAGTGVVWATIPRVGDANQNRVPGHLFAFNAETLALLYSSTAPGDDLLNYAKASPPVVANGKVYAASLSRFVSVYGPKSDGQVVQDLALNRPLSAYTGSTPCSSTQTPDKAFNGTAEGGPSDKWCSNVPNAFLQVDLGTTFSVNRFVLEHAGAGAESFGNNTRNFIIQVSLEGTNFDTVLEVSDNTFSITTHDISPFPARFVRFVSLDPTASIYEFQIFGSPEPSTPDFLVSTTPSTQTVTAGTDASYTVAFSPVNGFSRSVALSISGVPAGTTASFSPASISGSQTSTLTLSTMSARAFGILPLTITGTSGTLTRTTIATLILNRNGAGSVTVNTPAAVAAFDVPNAITTDGTTFFVGFDFGGTAYSANLLGSSRNVQGIPFSFGAPNTNNGWNTETVPLPAGQFATLGMLGATSFAPTAHDQIFTVTYTDGTTDAFSQSISDWIHPAGFPGEVIAVSMPYRNVFDGTRDTGNAPFLYGYFFDLNPAKTVSSFTLADPFNTVAVALTLVPSHDSAPNFALSASPSSLSLTRRSSATSSITVTPLNGFTNAVDLSVSGLPRGVTAFLDPGRTTSATTLNLRADSAAKIGTSVISITGRTEPPDRLTHTANIILAVVDEASSPVAVDLSSSFRRTGITTDGVPFTGGLDGDNGSSYSANLLGTSLVFDGTFFRFGPADHPDAIPCGSQVVPLSAGRFGSLQMLATGINGNQGPVTMTVNYSDRTSDSFSQAFSDWFTPQQFPGEAIAVRMPYRNNSNGQRDSRPFELYGYLFPIDNTKRVTSILLPLDDFIEVLAISLVTPSCIYALNPTAANALTFNGPFNVHADCGVVANSSSASALTLTGTGTLRAENVQVVGGVSSSPTAIVSPTPNTGDFTQPDPLRFLAPPPASTHCDFTNFTVSTSPSMRRQPRELSPGTYCNGITITGSTTEVVRVRFRPGTYVLMGGGLNVQGPHVLLQGDGVTFFFTQGLGFSYGPLSINSATVVATLEAPHDGPMEGILFFQDPSLVAGQPASTLKASSLSTVEGTVYFPRSALNYSVGGRGGDFLILVADTLTISGSVVLRNDFSDLRHGSPFHH